MDNNIYQTLLDTGLPETIAGVVTYALLTVAIVALTLLVTWVVRKILVRSVTGFVQANKYTWDDPLLSNKLFERLSWYVPLVILYLAQDMLMPKEGTAGLMVRRLLLTFFVVVTVRCVTALLNSINDIYRAVRREQGVHLRGYIDAAKIIAYVMGAIFVLAILTNRSPWGLLSVLGGLTAVTMLVFKDSILGFVASVQLTGTDMVKIGDWIEMPSYGADGDVIDISIHSVRVQNWDKTITTIPTYALIGNSFRNWRGMAESGGRRIKRPLNIDMNSIHFVSDDELAELGRIERIKDYIQARQNEIEQYNRDNEADTSILINGRRQTNIGIFRAYVVAYLKHNPKINRDMTFLIRHLTPGKNGLPIEIYVFSSDKVWANYEAIQADIFDHLLAALPVFGLRVFQDPTGYDFRMGRQEEKSEKSIGS